MALSVQLTSTVDPSASPNRSPWIEQARRPRPSTPLGRDVETDVAVVGGGIAGVSTAFFLLRETPCRVALVEAWRVARGATGYNAGQLVSYFERPLCRLAEDHGIHLAGRAQRDVDAAWGLLDLMLGESEYPHAVPRIVGHMGMFTLDHLTVHLENNLVRKQAGLVREHIRISRDADFIGDIGPEYDGLYELVPQARIHDVLESGDARYRATLSSRKGCANGAAVCEHLVEYLSASYPDRFRVFEDSPVDRVELSSDRAMLSVGGRVARASRAVLCTNGFSQLEIANGAGPEVRMPELVQGTVGFMAAFLGRTSRPVRANSYLMSPRIGEGQAYFYVTRRPFEKDGEPRMLTAIGGPDAPLPPGATYVRDTEYPPAELAKLNEHIAPVMGWPAGQAPRYDYLWHGLMGYTEGQVRIIGAEPRNPVLLYNLGCNGVGMLPSIHGAWRIAQIVGGAKVEPSLFDPR